MGVKINFKFKFFQISIWSWKEREKEKKRELAKFGVHPDLLGKIENECKGVKVGNMQNGILRSYLSSGS